MSEQHTDSRSKQGEYSGSGTLLGAGALAPGFTLHTAPDRSITLAELRGKPVVLAFYPADWSAVCGDQMALYNELIADFRDQGAELFGVSVDGVWCHKAFVEARKLHFGLLSDFEPKGAVSRAYGAYREPDGVSERALFVIDAGGVIRWSYLSPIGVNPGADGILAALERLTPEQRGNAGLRSASATSVGASGPSETQAATGAGQ